MPVIVVQEDASVDEACRLLAERRIKKAPVVRDGKLVGTISRRDIVKKLSESIR